MAEVIGGAILSAVIGDLVKRLASPVVKKLFAESPAVSNVLETLDVKLRSTNSLLNDAEDKQVKDDNVKNWVDDLSEVLNEADNAADDIHTKALQCEIEGDHWAMNVTPNPFDKWAIKIKGKLEAIIGRLELLLGEAEILGLMAHVRSKRLLRSPAPLIEDPSLVYGRDGDQKAILDLLFPEKSNAQDKISVIPIVGMGGVGKTTLARLVYNDSRVKNHFEHRAWVTVSDDFDVLKLAKLALEGLSGKKCEVMEQEKIGEELKKFLGGKKFFLVLDDVWNENYTHWNSFVRFFQAGSDGGKIIVTTRSHEIGSRTGSVRSHSLRPMEDDDCWKLFQMHAFCSVEECTKHLETIGIEIVKKCKGLPLAVMSLARLLCFVSDPKEWEKVLKNDVWEIERRADDEILPSLWLSYSYLPSNVKRCFAYCSIFPKDYAYDKEEMVLLWMAEGLVQGKDMEDEGEEYFKTLVSRSLLQRSAKEESRFLMHDLVHDLATFVSSKGFCTRLREGDGLDCLTNKTRHLLCYSDVKGLSRASSLRTFISNYDMSEIPEKFRCLRVLRIRKAPSIDKAPDSIGKLKHLRYLDLSHSSIERLPDTICKLYNLQTLLLRWCVLLTHLPTNMDKLINLRHLDIRETYALKEIPPCIAKMKALRTISKFVVGSGMRISELKKFPHLRGFLNICGLENIVDANEVLEAEFKKKSCLTELILEWDSDSNRDRAILDAFQPHPNLKKLSIEYYGGNEFSSWVADHSFSNVTEVYLMSCKHCFQLPSFGQLPALKVLQVNGLNSVEKIGSEFYGPSDSTPFPSLKILGITCMNKLQSLSFKAQGAFPCLEELKLGDCLMLNTICLDSSHSLPSLKQLSIYNCPNLEFCGLSLPSSLKDLYISNCDMVYSQRIQWGLEALTTLTFGGCKNADSFPEEGLLPITLTNLEIKRFSNLKSLNGIAFQHLTTLKKLVIWECPKLLSLPEERLPASLEYLSVNRCSDILKARLEREIGEDWNKISHIPRIYLNF